MSDRWGVSVGELAAPSARPTTGDVVVCRGIDAGNPSAGYTWGSPARVLFASEGESGANAVILLEDANVDRRGPGDDTEWLDEVLPTDCVVPAGEEWRILDCWGLRPLCPRCGTTSRGILHGMVVGGDDADDVVLGGCIVDDEPARYDCSGCRHQF